MENNKDNSQNNTSSPEKPQKTWKCPTCGSQTERKTGLTKDNIKSLLSFRNWKKDLWVWALIIMILLSYYGYRMLQAEADAWKTEVLGDCHGFCDKLEAEQARQGLDNLTGLDFSKINLTSS